MTDDKDVTRRSFLTGSMSVIAGVTLLPIEVACQQSKPAAARNDSATAKELDAFIKGLPQRTNFPARFW